MHFNVAIFIDCWDTKCFEKLEEEAVPDIIAGASKLYHNFDVFFNSSVVTYDYLIDATYGTECPSASSVTRIFDAHPKNRFLSIRTVLKQNYRDVYKQLNLHGKQRVLICGLDLEACVITRELGVKTWLSQGHDVFFHRKFVTESASNISEISDQYIHAINTGAVKAYFEESLELVPYGSKKTDFIQVINKKGFS